MRFVPVKVSRSIGRKVLTTKKNSPHIFFAAGVAGVVVSTVLACKATLKLEEKLDEIKVKADAIPHPEPGMEVEHTKEVGLVYGKAVLDLGRLYGPALIVGTVSVACLTGSHVQLTRRNAALTFTLAAVSKAFDDYRLRVKEEIGEERELAIHRGVTTEVVEIDGKKEKIKVTDPNAWSPYARIFDEWNVNWQKDAEHNRIFLQCQQKYANDMLRARGHVFLNDVYDALGMERSRAGAVVGWIIDGDGDGYIDFGLFEARSARFINNQERSIILDFNVDGVVYNKIKE